MSTVLMRVLESTPSRYDRGIRLLTLGRADELYDELASHVEPGWRVLDLGTGTGALALRLAARGADVIALDVNPAMLDIARRKAKQARLTERVTWREMGIAELDTFDASAFDAISAGLCFSELTPDERRYALDQGHRILKPGGLLLLIDEVQPQSLPRRLLYGAVRAPLVALTWLLTQTTTDAVPNLSEITEAAGFKITEERSALLGSLLAIVAEKSIG